MYFREFPDCLQQCLPRRQRCRLLLRRNQRTERHSSSGDRDKTYVVMGNKVSSLARHGGRFNATALRLAVCDHFHRSSVRYVMVSLSLTAYTDTIDRGSAAVITRKE